MKSTKILLFLLTISCNIFAQSQSKIDELTLKIETQISEIQHLYERFDEDKIADSYFQKLKELKNTLSRFKANPENSDLDFSELYAYDNTINEILHIDNNQAIGSGEGQDSPSGTNGIIRGIVTDNSTGNVFTQGSVNLYNENGDYRGGSSIDNLGRYRFTNVASGRYVVFVRSYSYSDVIDTVYPNYPCLNGLGYGCQISELTLIELAAGEVLDNINVAMVNKPVISGNISDQADALLKIDDVQVSLYTFAGSLAANVYSDELGNYAIAAPDAGDYYLQFSHSLYQKELYNNVICNGSCDLNLGTPIHLSTNQRLENLNITMKKNSNLSGTVIDADTLQLLNESNIYIENENNQIVYSKRLYSNTTWSAPLPIGLYTVSAERSGYLASKFDNIGCPSIDIYECNNISGTQINHTIVDTNNITVKMQKGAYITGTITDSTNQPVSNINVHVYNSDNDQSIHAGGRSGVDGSFTTQQLGNGSYYLVISSSYNFSIETELYDNIYCDDNGIYNCDFNLATPITISNQNNVNNINFQVKPLSQVSGRVVDNANNPISGLQVVLRLSTSSYQNYNAITDANGEYLIDGIRRGTYQLYISGGINYYSESYNDIQCVNSDCSNESFTPLVMNQSDLSNLDFQLNTKGKVTFNLNSNSPNVVDSGYIRVTDVNGQLLNYSSNNFEMSLPAGNYYFYYEGYSYYNSPHKFVSKVYGGSNCVDNCDATTGTLVHVSDNAQQTLTMNLDEYFYIDVTNTNPNSYTNAILYNQDFTQFLLRGFNDTTRLIINDNLPKYLKFSNSQFYSQLYSDINCIDELCDLSQGSLINPQLNTFLAIDFTLTPLATLQGRVTDENNVPISGVTVSLQSDLTQNYSNPTVQTNSNGEYIFDSLPIGDWYLKVKANDTYYEFGENATTYYGNIACDEQDCSQLGISPITVNISDNLTNFDIQVIRRGTLSGEGIQNVFNENLAVDIDVIKTDNSSINISTLVSNGTLNPIHLPMGEYNLVAHPQNQYVLTAYPNFDCGNETYNASCAINAVPLQISNGNDTHFNSFIVHQQGLVKGVIRDSITLLPINNAPVELYNLTNGYNRIAYGSSDSDGNYELRYRNEDLLKVYFKQNSQQSQYISQLYDGINCIGGIGIDCLLTQGQDVSFAHDTINIINVDLMPKPALTVSLIDNVTNESVYSYVNIYDLNNNLIYNEYNSSQNHLIETLNPGSYYAIARVNGSSYPTTGYPNINCPNISDPSSCQSTLTPIELILGDPLKPIEIHANLLQGISGYVRDSNTGLPLENIIIDYWNENGNIIGSVATSSNGGFSQSTNAGNYYLSTDTNNAYFNEIYNDIYCEHAAITGTCDVTQGLMINVPQNNINPIIIDVNLNKGIFNNGFE